MEKHLGRIRLKNQPTKLPDTFSALGNASNGAMNVYVAGKDIKVTVLIVEGLNKDFIIGMTLI